MPTLVSSGINIGGHTIIAGAMSQVVVSTCLSVKQKEYLEAWDVATTSMVFSRVNTSPTPTSYVESYYTIVYPHLA